MSDSLFVGCAAGPLPADAGTAMGGDADHASPITGTLDAGPVLPKLSRAAK